MTLTRLALVGLVGLLQTQAACESCGFSLAPRSLEVTVRLVDSASVPLDAATFMAKLEVARIESCVEDPDESCGVARIESTEPQDASFMVRGQAEAIQDGARCSYPAMRIDVQIAGCDAATSEIDSTQSDDPGVSMASMTIVCHDV